MLTRYPELRYLDAGGSGLTAAQVKGNVMLIHLSVARCSLRQLTHLPLPNLHSLDLRDNHLASVHWEVLVRLPRLHVLLLAGNPLTSSFLAGRSTPSATAVPPGGGGATPGRSRPRLG